MSKTLTLSKARKALEFLFVSALQWSVTLPLYNLTLNEWMHFVGYNIIKEVEFPYYMYICSFHWTYKSESQNFLDPGLAKPEV